MDGITRFEYVRQCVGGSAPTGECMQRTLCKESVLEAWTLSASLVRHDLSYFGNGQAVSVQLRKIQFCRTMATSYLGDFSQTDLKFMISV